MNTSTNNNTAQDKLFFRIVMALSITVFLTVIILNRKIIPRPDTFPDVVYFLPKLNAFINGTCSLLLLVSLIFIKQKNIQAHKITNIITFILSSIFLISYVVFHYLVDNTLYPDNGYRTLYFAILIPHIVLAALVLPLILLSFYHGLKMNVEKHKKLVRFAYPIWLFVTVSGVVVYLMISPYYAF
ncbi:MAG: DUF420 domain-containing protein [Bacteroidia bacterium]|jgi:putative membrane protein|nr:DUF420 domain-containing protein [Bacteroidia bacterium]